MSDFGIKVSTLGSNVNTAAIGQLALSSSHAMPKCDLRPTPKHYGLINFTVSNLAVSTSKTIYQIPHGYLYIPAFLTQWNIPAGTADPNIFPTSNLTYGIGDADMALNNGAYINMKTDVAFFTVTITNNGSNPVTVTGSIRFYIFADDFSGR